METVALSPPENILGGILVLPDGVEIGRRGLLIPKTLTDAELPALGAKFIAVRGFSKWALGAVLCEMVERRPKLNDRGQDTGERNEDWAYEYSEAMGLDPKERREIMGVYTFYSGDSKTRELSWEHYREAMWATDDNRGGCLPRALAYLDKAIEEGWSKVSDMRRYIRSQQQTEQPDHTQTEFDGYGVVFDFRRYAARELSHVEQYTAERARIVLDDIGSDAINFIEKLQTIAKG